MHLQVHLDPVVRVQAPLGHFEPRSEEECVQTKIHVGLKVNMGDRLRDKVGVPSPTTSGMSTSASRSNSTEAH